MATVTQGWFVDPVGRFDGRLFDGDVWTDQVSQGGKLIIDVDWAATTPSTVTQSATASSDDRAASVVIASTATEERRRGSDRRQVNIEVAVDRRRGDRRIVIPTADQ